MRKSSNLSPQILKRYKTLSLVKEGFLTLSRASEELELSYRHTHRLFYRLLRAGMNPETLLYKRTHPSWNRLCQEEREKVIEVFDSYPEINNYHLCEVLEETLERSLSPSTIRSILIENGRYRPQKKKRRARKRFERKSFGELVQMDTSEHLWLPILKTRTFLVAMQDDYSRELLVVRIFSSDTTWNNLCVIRETVQRYGIFSSLYIDNDSMFKFIRKGIFHAF